jgi:hypothetical protein
MRMTIRVEKRDPVALASLAFAGAKKVGVVLMVGSIYLMFQEEVNMRALGVGLFIVSRDFYRGADNVIGIIRHNTKEDVKDWSAARLKREVCRGMILESFLIRF